MGSRAANSRRRGLSGVELTAPGTPVGTVSVGRMIVDQRLERPKIDANSSGVDVKAAHLHISAEQLKNHCITKRDNPLATTTGYDYSHSVDERSNRGTHHRYDQPHRTQDFHIRKSEQSIRRSWINLALRPQRPQTDLLR